MDIPPYDPRLVDVVEMARVTQIDILKIYKALGTTPDGITQMIQERKWGARSMEEFAQAHQDEIDYRASVGAEHLKGFTVKAVTDPAEIERLEERRKAGCGANPTHLLALMQARLRAESGIPWGTQEQVDRVIQEMLQLDSWEESLDFYSRIPVPAPVERSAAIRMIARFFVRDLPPAA